MKTVNGFRNRRRFLESWKSTKRNVRACCNEREEYAMDYKFVKTFAEKIADEADVDKLIKEYKKKTDKSRNMSNDFWN